MPDPLKVALWGESLVGAFTGTRTLFENIIMSAGEFGGDRVSFTIVCPRWGDEDKLSRDLPPGNWNIKKIDAGSKWSLRMAWLAGRRSLTKQIGRHDVYMSGWHWPLGNEDVPFIGVVHDLRPLAREWTDRQLPAWKKLAFRNLQKLATRRCISQAAAIIAPSEYTMNHMRELGFNPRQPEQVIPHGVRHDFWVKGYGSDRLANLLREIGANPDSPYVLSVGQHTPHKNFGRLVEAFHKGIAARDRDAQLIIAGGENCESDKLRSLAEKCGISHQVILAGSVSFENLRILMGSARLFAFPSLFEGFGLPVLEAFAAQRAVVSSKAASLAEVAGEAAVLFDPRNVSEMAFALEQVWTDESFRQTLENAGFERAANYRWDEVTEQYLKLFEVVAGRRSTV